MISEQVLFGWVKEKVQKRWSELWKWTESGMWTKLFLRDVGKKLIFPRDRSSGMTYVRALLNHAAVADNMARMGLAETTECVCGEGRETVEHVIMECSVEAEARKVLIDEIGDFWMNKKMAGDLQFNLELVLDPFANRKLNYVDSLQVMKSVFSFFARLSRKL